ncbi:hypothetical protein SAMN05216410_2198 [Sanguibacter gelidistatuariae]|uniref:Uncharacterized protein n=1 Tax=Sanguibacter gelidistatuariae TaxID=1814289 RepID=A0A1G6NQJ9_9MICO|nr:hypothetical protein [Sanguibacter gelidistatuariae]SDC69654.1 hypothetical protein SAMN05216410_2198 [Sanguibacter gelidistatuariae]
MTAEVTSRQFVGRGTSRWWLIFAILAPATASAATAATLTYRQVSEWFGAWTEQATLVGIDAALPAYGIAPLDYLPAGATMAALTVLCTAIGAQLLTPRPWRSAAALAIITAALVLSDSVLLSDGVWLPIASIWAGTVLLWSEAVWRATPRRDASPLGDPAPSAPRSSRDELARSTHHTVTVFAVFMLAIVVGLIIFSAVGGLRLFFSDGPPRWSDLTYSAPAHLAALAIWAGWLSGRRQARAHATTWRIVAYAGIALGAVEGITYVADDGWTMAILSAVGVAIATNRQHLAARAERLLTL